MEKLVSSFCFEFNLRRYNMVGAAADGRDGRGGAGVEKTAAGNAADHRDTLERGRLRSVGRCRLTSLNPS